MVRDSTAERETLRRAIAELHVASFAWARACSAAEAEDVLQSAYVKVVSGAARFDGRSSVKTWLFGVIRLTALEHRRRAWMRRLRLVPMAREPSDAGARGAERAAEQTSTARALVDALGLLPERQRQVLHLVFYEDMTVDDAATAMGVSVGTARVHYDRGKKRLAELLRERGIEP